MIFKRSFLEYFLSFLRSYFFTILNTSGLEFVLEGNIIHLLYLLFIKDKYHIHNFKYANKKPFLNIFISEI